MAETGDVLEFTIHQRYSEQTVKNIFHYHLIGTPSSVQDCVDGFILTFMGHFKNMLSTGHLVEKVTGRNLFDLAEQGETILNETGTVSDGGDGYPPFVAWGFQLVTDAADVRMGAKRFAGIREAWTADGKTPTPAFLPRLDTVGAELSEATAAIGGSALGLVPIVVKRVFEIATGYRLPETLAELAATGFGHIIDYVIRGTTTQNSRKLGSGS